MKFHNEYQQRCIRFMPETHSCIRKHSETSSVVSQINYSIQRTGDFDNAVASLIDFLVLQNKELMDRLMIKAKHEVEPVFRPKI